MDSLAPHLALFNEEYIPGPQSSMGMHSQQRNTESDLFATALNSHFVDSFSADAGYSMDRMDQTFSMLEPQRQRSTDTASNIFDTISEQSFGDAISVDSFDFDILDHQDSCGASNPVSTSTPFSCEFKRLDSASSFAPSGSTDATGFARQPAGMPQNRAQTVQSRMTRLRLSPLETIEITHTASDGTLPKRKRKRNMSYRNLHAYGVGEPVEPAARPAPTSRELVSCAAREDSRRSCKRQTKESAVGRYMYVCNYCKRHKVSASKGQDGRVRIRCECGGKHRDGTPRMHAQWSAAVEDDQESY
jgi:hypothetical protein